MWILVIQRITLEFLFDLVYFPIWWYTGGIKHAGGFCFHLVQLGNARLAPALWVKNIFVPMFGQTDIQGRLVSVLMRFLNIIFRTIALLIWMVVVACVFTLWLILPVVVVYMLMRSLS